MHSEAITSSGCHNASLHISFLRYPEAIKWVLVQCIEVSTSSQRSHEITLLPLCSRALAYLQIVEDMYSCMLLTKLFLEPYKISCACIFGPFSGAEVEHLAGGGAGLPATGLQRAMSRCLTS